MLRVISRGERSAAGTSAAYVAPVSTAGEQALQTVQDILSPGFTRSGSRCLVAPRFADAIATDPAVMRHLTQVAHDYVPRAAQERGVAARGRGSGVLKRRPGRSARRSSCSG
jgi:hypothetical protein